MNISFFYVQTQFFLVMYFNELCSRILAPKLLKKLEWFMHQVCVLPVPVDLCHVLSKFPKKKLSDKTFSIQFYLLTTHSERLLNMF